MGKKIALLNDWYFSSKYEAGMESDHSLKGMVPVQLPHTNVELPYHYFSEAAFQTISCYEKIFKSPELSENQILRIRFEGVMAWAKVYLNNVYLGEHLGGYTPFSFEIQEIVKEHEDNFLTVVVDSTERPDVPPFGGVIDYLTYGGIYREVYLEIFEPLFINNVKAEAIDVLKPVKGLKLDIFTDNRIEKVWVETEVNITLSDLSGWVMAEKSESIVIEPGKQRFTVTIENIKDICLWDINDPTLYLINVEIKYDDKVEKYSTRFGFRECAFTPKGFLLNGKRLKIVGLNRHQSYPYVGYAMPKRVQQKDADIIKYELCCNTVRTSHYPQSTHFLDRCDEIGLLVFEEIPGWQHIGNEEWKEVALQNIQEMIERDWNHPSIIIWGVRINESNDDDSFYERTNKLARSLDNTRQTGGVRCIRNSKLLEDVYTMNDFVHSGNNIGLNKQQDITGLSADVPYLITEYNGHMYPTKKADNEERQVSHVLRHLKVQDASWADESISGAIGWCAFDYNTHSDFGAGDMICHHGVMDMFRIPKFAAYTYGSQIAPEIKTVLVPVTYWARGERSECTIFPLIVLSNCDWITLKFGDYNPIAVFEKSKEFRHLPYPPFIIDTSVIPIEQINQWGMKWEDGIITGYIGGKPVKEVRMARNPLPSKLMVAADDHTLTSGEKDATRVVVKLVDQYNRPLPFINAVVRLKISGNARIIGPEEIFLTGGSAGFWVESNGVAGEIKIDIACGGFKAEIKLLVQ
ncbi:MAG: glycoside hydrolase family 2 protein [Clostridiaceae bacterium]|nr:glycoside hydrolase family 2 protein [Clostridiaceae bacterium]